MKKGKKDMRFLPGHCYEYQPKYFLDLPEISPTPNGGYNLVDRPE
jgi:hypothetical protein